MDTGAAAIRGLLDRQPAAARDLLAAFAPLTLRQVDGGDFNAVLLARNTALPWGSWLSSGDPPASTRWSVLSDNRGTWWTASILGRHADRWDWKRLSANPALPWSADLIAAFIDRLDWPTLCDNRGVPWTDRLVTRFDERVIVSRLAANTALRWTPSLFARLEPRLQEADDRYWPGERPQAAAPGVMLGPDGMAHLLQNHNADWDRLLPRLPSPDWRLLSRNRGLPWTARLLADHADAIDWSALSANPGLPWSLDLLQRFSGRWSLFHLAGNPALPWADHTPALLDFLGGLRNLAPLASNSGIHWTVDLLAPRLDDLFTQRKPLSRHARLSPDILDHLGEQLDWPSLSGNRHLPWSAQLIARHADRWQWEILASNPALPWDPALVAAFADRWDLRGFVRNEAAWRAVAVAGVVG